MKKVTLKDLKESLSEITEFAANGQMIEVTKYNRPYIILCPAKHPGLHIGKDSLKPELKSIGNQSTKGRFLSFLEEDRSDG